MHTTSATLLAKVRHLGDAAAWSRFVEVYSPLLYNWSRHMGLRHDDAVDLVQDVFAVLVQQLPEFDYDGHQRFRGWLWTVTRRRWADRKRRAALPVDPACDPGQIQAEPAAGPGPDEIDFQDHLLRHLLPASRGHFQETTWRAFWKHVVDDRPAAEVAAEEGLSVASVYKAKLRVTARLRRDFADLIAEGVP